MSDLPRCFVIAPIGERGSDIRKQSDMVLEYIIKRALEPQYKVKRADDDERPGEITKQMVVDIEGADLIVCNLSGLNANVMYELGLAHARQKKVVHIFDRSTSLPFDVRQSRSIEFDIHDPQSHKEAIDLLRKYEKTLAQAESVSNPFTEAMAGPIKLNEKDLKDQTIASLISEVEELSSRLSGVEALLPASKKAAARMAGVSHVDGAGKLIDLLNERPGFQRVALDEREGHRSLIVYGDLTLNPSDLPDAILGIPVEYRLS